jgi:flagellar hook assembly protein FlgD
VTAASELSAFSPNQDGDQDTAIVLYTVSEGATVSARVLDGAGTQVRTLLAEQPTGRRGDLPGSMSSRISQRSLVWDGRDDHGRVVMDGQYYVRVTAQGSARQSSASVPVLVDTVPPVIRLANMPEDMQVKDETIVIEGVTEPDATVWLNKGPRSIPVDASGGFRIEHRLQEGENRIELSVTDVAGNRASIARQAVLLLKPPDIVVDNPPNDLWINQKLLSVQGRVSPGSQLTVNGTEAVVDENGRYNVDILLQEGDNLLVFEATDVVGNASTTERRVYLKTRAPVISLTSIKEGMEVRESSLLVVGQTEVGAAVRLNGRELAVDSRGGFQGLVTLVQGENLIRAEAVDRAGNTSTLARRVRYVEPTARAVSVPNPNLIAPVLILAAGTILVSWLLFGGWLSPISIAFSADRPIIQPDPNEYVEPLLLSLELSRPARVTVDVWDEDDQLVGTLLYRRRRGSGGHVLVWDGCDDQGVVVPAGVYEIEATASTFTTAVSSSVRVEVEAPSGQRAGRRGRRRTETSSYSG